MDCSLFLNIWLKRNIQNKSKHLSNNNKTLKINLINYVTQTNKTPCPHIFFYWHPNTPAVIHMQAFDCPLFPQCVYFSCHHRWVSSAKGCERASQSSPTSMLLGLICGMANMNEFASSHTLVYMTALVC